MANNPSMEIRGATVLLTGASGGIGQALSRALTAAGADVIGADLGGADLDLDVTDARAVAAAIDALDRLDIVVANAGIGVGGLVDDLPVTAWQRTIDVNIAGVVNTVVPAYARLRTQGRGAIVLMASLAGIVATPLLVPYAMSKHAIVGLGAALRPEAARYGVGVTTVCPGPVETALLDEPSHTPGLSVRRYLTAAAGAPIAPDALAARVVDAVRTDRRLVTPGRAGVLWRAARFTPGITARVVATTMARELRRADHG